MGCVHLYKEVGQSSDKRRVTSASYKIILEDQNGYVINSPPLIYQNSIMIPRLYRFKIANFDEFHYLAIPGRDLRAKKTEPNIEK